MTLNLSKGTMKSHYFLVGSPGLLLLLVGFNVAFNNFSVLSRRCLVATGSSVLIPGHIILINILTLGRPVLALLDKAQNKILFVGNCLPTHTFTPYSTFFFLLFQNYFFFFFAFSIFQFQSEILKLYKLTRKKNPKGSLA